MTGMRYAKIPHVGKKVSRIFCGTAMAALTEGSGGGLLDVLYETGVNAFDTARVYEGAERSLGRWMAERGNREDVVILSKCGHPDASWRRRVNEADIRKDFAASAAQLNTDYIDIYLLHRDDPDVEAGVAVEIFNALHAEGKIRAFGGSNWTHRRIEEANEYAYKHGLIPFSVSSPNFGLAVQARDPWGGGCVTISGPDNREARAWYVKTQMPVVAYSSLARGLFSGRIRSDEAERAGEILDGYAMKGFGYPENFERLRRCEILAKERGCTVPQIAMAWIFRQDINTFAVVSASSAERMRENIAALHIELSREELLYLDLRKDTLTGTADRAAKDTSLTEKQER